MLKVGVWRRAMVGKKRMEKRGMREMEVTMGTGLKRTMCVIDRELNGRRVLVIVEIERLRLRHLFQLGHLARHRYLSLLSLQTNPQIRYLTRSTCTPTAIAVATTHHLPHPPHLTESWSLTPNNALRSRSITRAQPVIVVHDINPFEDELENAVVEHLVLRARKMVMKHRRNGHFDDAGGLRTEREDTWLAVRCGV
jgi:hypothetical protein